MSEQPEVDATDANVIESTVLPDAPRFTPADVSDRRTVRWIVWAIGIALFLGYVVLARVHTRLGVDAPALDKDGREYVWRSWWRARHEVLDIGPSGFVVAIYVGLAVAFVALSILACWIALVAEEPAVVAPEAGSIVSQ